jgi:hypothetical protein
MRSGVGRCGKALKIQFTAVARRIMASETIIADEGLDREHGARGRKNSGKARDRPLFQSEIGLIFAHAYEASRITIQKKYWSATFIERLSISVLRRSKIKNNAICITGHPLTRLPVPPTRSIIHLHFVHSRH